MMVDDCFLGVKAALPVRIKGVLRSTGLSDKWNYTSRCAKVTIQQPTCGPGALPLLKDGLQHLCGRSTLEDLVLEMGKGLSEGPDGLPPRTAILHGEELPAEIVEPQHVGVGVEVSPVVPEIRHGVREKTDTEKSVSSSVSIETVSRSTDPFSALISL